MKIDLNKALSSPLLAIIREFTRGYSTLLIFGFFSPILYLAAPFFGASVTERVGNSRNASTLITLILIGVVLMLAYTFLEFIRSQALDRMGTVIDERLTRICFDAFNREKSSGGGTPAQALSDLNTTRNFLCGPYLGPAIDAFWSPIFIIVLFLIHPVFGLMLVVLLAFAAAMSVATQMMVNDDAMRSQKRDMEANEFGLAVSRNAETVRAMGMLPWLVDRWYGMHREALGWRSLARDKAALMGLGPRFLQNAQIILVYSIGGFLFLANMINLGVIFIVMTVLMRTLGPLQYIINNWSTLQSFIAAAQRLDALLRSIEARPEPIDLPTPQGALVVTRLLGGPPGSEKAIVNDVSFSVAPGRVLGIVGPSGAGKSCLARLLVGIWRARRGSIVFGDHDLSHWNQDQLGVHIGYMPQDVEFLPGTVGENISRFDPSATSESILAAVDMSGIHDLIRTLPDGYATRLGTGGHMLSGGQRQRIALARAVYGRPRLVVLDEPNSNLDAASEQILGQTVQMLRQDGATVIVVSHRVSLLGFCDDLLVLNEGTVQAFGTRDQIFNRLPRVKSTPQAPALSGYGEDRSA